MSTISSSSVSTATPSPLAVPIFRAVWLASVSSNFGGLVQAVGASWLMTQLSSSEQQMALMQASTVLPIMMLSLLAGAVADNLDRRVVMLCAQVFMLAVLAGLAACAWAGVLTAWLLLGFAFAIGCGTAFNNPAWQASVGDMVPRAALPGAVALNLMGFNTARSVGPAIGGAIVAAAGAAGAFATNAGSYLALIAVLWRWRPEPRPRALPRERIPLAMADGLRYVAMSPRFWTVLLCGAVFGAGASAVPALMPLVARDLVAGGPLTYGLLLGAFGVGAVGGALSSGWLRRALDGGHRGRGLGGAGARRGRHGRERGAGGDGPGADDGGRGLGAGAVDLQRLGADVHASLARGPRALALPDGDLRRHGAGRVDVRPAGADAGGERGAPRRGRAPGGEPRAGARAAAGTGGGSRPPPPPRAAGASPRPR